MYKQYIEEMKKRLITGEEFNLILGKIMMENSNDLCVLYELSDGNGNTYKFGKEGENDHNASKTMNLQGGFSVKVSLWYKKESYNVDDYEEVFEAFWNKETCDQASGMPLINTEGFEKKCNQTLEYWRENEQKFAVFMIDLDHFGEVNTKYNHDIGNKVILEFSKLLYAAIGKKAILLHQSGDEFNVLLVYQEYTEVLELAHNLYRSTKGKQFSDAPDVDVTMSMGIWLIENGTYIENRNKAERAYNPEGRKDTKRRNSVRIDKTCNEIYLGSNSIKLAISRIMALNNGNFVFHNVYLDYISQFVSKMSDYSKLQQEIEDILQWIKPIYIEELRCTSVIDIWDAKAKFSKIEVGIAVFHGLLQNRQNNNIEYRFEIGVDCIIKDGFGKEIYKIENCECSQQLALEIKDISAFQTICDARKTLLVQSGYSTEIPVPKDVFYKIEPVDARPTVGGGLPDFWEATIASLISTSNENPGLTDIIIFGELEYTQRVVYFLETIDEWNQDTINQIAKKTFKTYDEVLKFKERFRHNIKICKTIDEVIEAIYAVQTVFVPIVHEEVVSGNNNRFMERNFLYDSVSLKILDGCSVNTIAEAFPIVLEIIRNSTKENRHMIDQAGRELVELTNFKILIKTPLKDMVPGYYTSREEFDDYYESVFEKDGLFRKKIDESKQIERMLEHIYSVISSENPYATRRAILVVQNDITVDGNYSPLGLVSIWVAPRFEKDIIILDYSFTWRTVEAMVGLPFSMYASVRFAETIMEQLNEKYKCGTNVIMGQVSYNAYSLHMFLDKERMNIARGIINEVSK